MLGHQESEIVPTITEITQIGNVTEIPIESEMDGDEIESDIQETETETMALNAAFEKPSYFCDNCAGYTNLAKDLIGEGTACTHCDESLFAPDMDEETDIIVPHKTAMFHAVLSGNLLKAIVGNLATLTNEVKLNISPDGITVRAVDAAHVAILEMDVPRSAFDTFRAYTFQLGIDVEKFQELSKMCKKDTTVKLEVIAGDKDRLSYQIGNVSGDMIPVDTAGMSDPKIPAVNLPCHFDAAIKDILDICKRAATISDHITIFAEKDKVTISANGECDNTKMILTNGQEIQFLTMTGQDNALSMFTLDYLSNMIKALKPCAKTVTIEMGTDYPIRVKTNLFNGEGDVTYLLAPRIETD